MLQRILCSGPDTNPLVGECLFLNGYVDAFWAGASFFNAHTRYFFDSPEELRSLFGRHLDEVLAAIAGRYGFPKALVLKNPQLTMRFPILSLLAPRARFVVIVREAKDTVASCLTAKQRGAFQFQGMNAEAIARDLMRTYEPCFTPHATDFPNKVHFVRYEDVVRFPRAAAATLSQVLDIDLSSFSPEEKASRSVVDDWSGDGVLRPYARTDFQGAVKASRIGSHAEVLSESEARVVDDICALLRAFDRYLPIAEPSS